MIALPDLPGLPAQALPVLPAAECWQTRDFLIVKEILCKPKVGGIVMVGEFVDKILMQMTGVIDDEQLVVLKQRMYMVLCDYGVTPNHKRNIVSL